MGLFGQVSLLCTPLTSPESSPTLKTMERVAAEVIIRDEFTPATTFATFADLVNVVIRNAFVLAGIMTFILLILGGFGIIVGAGNGDTKKLEQGKKTLTGAVIGLLLVVGSLWIVQLVELITGISLLKPSN